MTFDPTSGLCASWDDHGHLVYYFRFRKEVRAEEEVDPASESGVGGGEAEG